MDNTEAFYSEVAQQCGKSSLDPNEAEIACRARQAAVLSFEQHGATVPPSPDLVYSVAWLMTQSQLTAERSAASGAVKLVELVFAAGDEQRRRIAGMIAVLETDSGRLETLRIKRQCGLVADDQEFLDLIDDVVGGAV